MKNTILLGDVCQKIGSGATPRGGSDVYLQDGEFSLIRSQNVHNNRFEKTGLAFISQKQADELQNVKVLTNDVLLNITGDSVARVCQVPESVLPARVNQHVAIIRPDASQLDARYLLYCLVDPVMQDYLLMMSSGGATRNALTKTMIEDLKLVVPDLIEQRAIAHVLGVLDDKIELNRRMNATLETMTQTLFRSWFVDFDPVKAKAEGREPEGMDAETAALFPDAFLESEMGLIPAEWTVNTLGKVAENPRRSVDPRSLEPSTPYIGLEHMPRKSIVLSDCGSASDVESGKSAFYEDEILFGKLRPYFHKVGIANTSGVCSTDIVVIAPHLGWQGFVLGHVFSDAFIDHVTACSDGTRMPRTSWGDMVKYRIALPPQHLAQSFQRQVSSAYSKIRANSHESTTLAAQRDALLPKLISGEVRLPDEMVQSFAD